MPPATPPPAAAPASPAPAASPIPAPPPPPMPNNPIILSPILPKNENGDGLPSIAVGIPPATPVVFALIFMPSLFNLSSSFVSGIIFANTSYPVAIISPFHVFFFQFSQFVFHLKQYRYHPHWEVIRANVHSHFYEFEYL
ncbi:MAG: hypothetical protein DRN17_02120 [Thermoplasmata archaeon]|nr:MAG: hypothetical protein DRN17_02120 [Thermoplasmata archaeon]